jgi:histidine triad (HIT) family protein
MNECIFCKIINGEISTPKIYEDDDIVAFLDIHPINKGHTLIIPKKHVPNFLDLEDKLYLSVMKVAKQLATVIDEKLEPEKVGLIIAGWDVAHVHIHVIPMHDYHDITSKRMLEGTSTTLTEQELREVTELLKTY